MSNILLVQPKVGDWDYMRSHPIPPLSLLSSITLCEKEAEIRWVDQRISPDWKKEVNNSIDAETLCVGTTSYTGPMIADSLEISRFVKSIRDVPVVWGGIHASLLPQQTLEDRSVDIVVQGEGEKTFMELLKCLKNKGNLKNVRGICYKENGNIHSNPERLMIDFDSLPPLPYHVISMEKYMPLYQGKRSFYYQTSRGCPYPCTYCYNSVYNHRRWRAKSSRKVLRELKDIVSIYRPEHIYIIDDIFFVDRKRSREIIQGIKEMGVTWDLQGVDILSLQGMDREYIEFLEAAGCTRLSIGIESGSQRIRKLMKKKPYECSKIFQILKKFEDSSIVIYCNYIAGTPTETDEDLKSTIDLIFSLDEQNPRIRNFPIYNYIPYPGTEMYELAVKEGFVPPGSLMEWSRGEWGQVLGHSYIDFKGSRRRSQKFYRSLFFVSLFIDDKLREYTVPRTIRVLSALYRPLARFRLRRLILHLLIERYLAEVTLRIWVFIKGLARFVNGRNESSSGQTRCQS